MLTAAVMRTFWDVYRAGHPADDPALDVTRGDLAGAPPARIAVAAHDPLRDDGLRYAEQLADAGAGVATRIYPTMTHGFLRWGGVVGEAGDLIAWLTEGLGTAAG
jgi:acetyl esterase/lipase